MARLPEKGIAAWPVGNGDALTLRSPDGLTLQFDINHSKSDDNDWAPVVDLLAEELDTVTHNGDELPELPVLALSHHDEDHCRGITRLVSQFRVNELIVTPRCFVEADELTDLGQELLEEVERRRDLEIDAAAEGGRANAGGRLQIVGYADVLETDGWEDFPDTLLTIPGNLIELLDNEDHSDSIEVFAHSPFRVETEDGGDRNDSCLAVHVTITSEETSDRYLLLGDLNYDTIEAIFEISEDNDNAGRLEWDVLVAPHHCSRHAVRTSDGAGGFVDASAAEFLGEYAAEGAVVIVSSDGDYTGPTKTGKNPPHSDAKTVYEGIVTKPNVHDTHHEAKGSDSHPVAIEAGTGNAMPTPADRAARMAALATSAGAPLVTTPRHIEGGDKGFA